MINLLRQCETAIYQSAQEFWNYWQQARHFVPTVVRSITTLMAKNLTWKHHLILMLSLTYLMPRSPISLQVWRPEKMNRQQFNRWLHKKRANSRMQKALQEIQDKQLPLLPEAEKELRRIQIRRAM